MKFLIILITSLALPTSVAANIVTRCGASKGYAHYFEGALVSRDKAGWTDDGISSGSLQLVRDGDAFDIIVTDAAGTKSLRADGFQVLNVPQPKPDFVAVLSIHRTTGVVEHFLFQLDGQGRGTVVWGSIKGSGATLQKSSLLKATCNSP